MGNILPVKYRKASPAIISYDWGDVLSGISYVTFNCWSHIDNTSTYYRMDENFSAFGRFGSSFGANATYNTWATIIDATFTSTAINISRELNGRAWINIPKKSAFADADAVMIWKFTVTISGSTSGTIGTDTVQLTETEGATNGYSYNQYIPIDIANHTIVAGETLSLAVKVEIFKSNDVPADDVAGIVCYDPQNQAQQRVSGAWDITLDPASDYGTTVMSLWLPFKAET